MLVKIFNGKIVSIRIGEFKESDGDIFVPDEWGTNEIEEFILGRKKAKKSKKNSINLKDPDKKFNLLKI